MSTACRSPANGAPGHDEEARRRCYAALLDDLRQLSRRRAGVVLLDQYERATTEIEDWLEEALLARILQEAEQFGPLVIVVASRAPVFERVAADLGSRADGVLHAIDGLSSWSDDHIAQWLQLLGIYRRSWSGSSDLCNAIRSCR